VIIRKEGIVVADCFQKVGAGSGYGAGSQIECGMHHLFSC